MKYRAEIDGLRALAVVPVILFHAGFELFSGGFVGVDVFFVISGYLITTILIEDLENQRFSLVSFYERRARRILPALFFVMFVCIPFAWMWMLPSQMKDFSQSLVAVSLFASNILFWRESGYFGAAAEEKPLLHTWSLAVEEQYYVLFPIFLFLAWRYGKNRVFWMIVVMASISLLLSEWGWRNKASANFYLAPTRAWELFAGSIAAFIVQKNGVRKDNFLALLGLAAIIFSIFAYDESTPFPSVYALVPVLGVVLLILYADKETIAAKLLSTKGFVGIGLLSYSAYLWHQPLFAYSSVIWIGEVQWVRIVLILLTLPIAYLSWRYVERPFRDRARFTRNKIFVLSFISLSMFFVVGIAGHLSNGFQDRFTPTAHYQLTQTPELFNIECLERYPIFANLSTCRASSFNEPEIALIGDSHSHALYESLAARYSEHTVINLGVWSCFPFVNNEHFEKNDCGKKQIQLFNFLETNTQIHTIILSGYWGYLASGGFDTRGVGWRLHSNISDTDAESFIENASDFFTNLDNESIRLVIVEDVPDLDFNPVECGDVGLFRFVKSNCTMSNESFIERKSQVDSVMNRLANIFSEVNYVRTEHIFCSEEGCSSLINNETLYKDGDHLSRIGANLVVNELVKTLNE
jgi:peptidoglycan/LPS O-acetylase OafA/YrhL